MATTGNENELIDIQGLKSSLQKLKDVHIDGKAEKATTLAGYGITDAYTKTEVNNMITTPNQGYVTVSATAQTTSAESVLPATGASDTIYRVAKWDGTQYTENSYSEYAWNGTQYVFLYTKNAGLDNEPVAGSELIVKSGGVANMTNCIRFVGKGSTSVKCDSKLFIKNRRYTIYLKNTSWGIDSISSTANVFLVLSYDSLSASTYLVNVKKNAISDIQSSYTFNVPENSERVVVGFRGDVGATLDVVIEDVTDFIESNYISFAGNGGTIQSIYSKMFRVGHSYRISLDKNVWGVSSTSDSNVVFTARAYDSSKNEIFNFFSYKKSDISDISKEYTFIVPNYTAYVYIAFRGDFGEELSLTITEIMDYDYLSLFENFKRGKNVQTTRNPSFVMAHLSDLHGDEDCFKRIENFVSIYDDYIDLVLHTGDLVKNFYNHHIYWNDNPKFLLTTGNHDCSWRDDSVTPSVWRFVERDTVYNNLFAPYIANWNVVRPTGATTELYYYKDYAAYDIRLIVMDSFYWDADEATWLADVLNDAKASGLSIILASHFGPFKGTGDPSNPFDSIDWDTNNGMSDTALRVVDDFISNGGEIVCWFVGHQHADGFRTKSNHPGILVIAVSASGKTDNQEYARVVGTKSEDLFNIYSIDTAKKILSIVRVGADYDDYARHKVTLVYDYGNGQILTIN